MWWIGTAEVNLNTWLEPGETFCLCLSWLEPTVPIHPICWYKLFSEIEIPLTMKNGPVGSVVHLGLSRRKRVENGESVV